MTPERRQALMHEASEALQKQWGDVQPDALQSVADELRIQVVEGGALSVSDIVSGIDDRHDSRSLFTSAAQSGHAVGELSLAADRQEQDAEWER